MIVGGKMFQIHNIGINISFTVFACIATLTGFVLPESIKAGERTWLYDGTELEHALTGEEPSEFFSSGKVRHRRLSAGRARAYISGVADTTQGQIWCNPGDVTLNELADQVSVHLDYLPSARLKENAAVLVQEALSDSFPCKTGMRK